MPPQEDTLEDLVRRFSSLVRAAATRVGGSAGLHLADDVAQQVFVNIWRQLDREQTIVDPRSYVYKCAVRETVRLLQAEGRRPTVDLEEVAAEPQDTGRSPEDELAAQDTAAALAAALDTLAPDRRRAAEAHLQGYDVAEIMRMYGWPYQRARNLIARGMADLRAALAARGING